MIWLGITIFAVAFLIWLISKSDSELGDHDGIRITHHSGTDYSYSFIHGGLRFSQSGFKTAEWALRYGRDQRRRMQEQLRNDLERLGES